MKKEKIMRLSDKTDRTLREITLGLRVLVGCSDPQELDVRVKVRRMWRALEELLWDESALLIPTGQKAKTSAAKKKKPAPTDCEATKRLADVNRQADRLVKMGPRKATEWFKTNKGFDVEAVRTLYLRRRRQAAKEVK